MKHIVFYSGGSGSYEATRRVMEAGVDPQSIHLLFTDTCIEHKDLYKFLLQSFEFIYKVDLSLELGLVEVLPEVYEGVVERSSTLESIAQAVMKKVPNVHWLHYKYEEEHLTPWGIFEKQGFIGNSRIATCSTLIKQRLAREYFKRTWIKEESTVYFGIDWSESHRMAAPTANWGRFAQEVLFPLNEAPYSTSKQRIERLEEDGLNVPELYKLGFAHNNCGGFCVRGGQGHFKGLLDNLPEVFQYHAEKEASLAQDLFNQTGNKYSILTKQINREKIPLTLFELKAQVEGGEAVDVFDIGGCGCFVTDDMNDSEIQQEVKFSVNNLEIFKGSELIN